MRKVLVSWIGNTDLRAVNESETVGLGPIAQALTSRGFDEVLLLSDYPDAKVKSFVRWAKDLTTAKVRVVFVKLAGPTNFGEIYEAAARACSEALGGDPATTSLSFHLSPGTPAMAAVWIILSKTRFPAELIESSREHGVRTASVPFDISADYLPDLLRKPDKELERLSAGLPPEAPEFSAILHRSNVMKTVVARARRVAPRSVPVLIQGESGTGKELLARAIHQASPRRTRAFLAVNCGAIPAELVESELFGHERGAFTGATTARRGYFESANGGTLFLDEIGELPRAGQVKLLRVLQEGEVTPIGATAARKVDVRILAASNRDLSGLVAAGQFREDLFYRLAVAVLQLPPVRERPGDVPVLLDHLLDQVNAESLTDPGYRRKRLSVAARKILGDHPWPGNVREMLNTLRRAAVWSPEEVIGEHEARQAMLPAARTGEARPARRSLGGEFDLRALLASVARECIEQALEEAGSNKTKAASLLGLPSYQTLSNWMRRYGVAE